MNGDGLIVSAPIPTLDTTEVEAEESVPVAEALAETSLYTSNTPKESCSKVDLD